MGEWQEIADEAALREILGEPQERAVLKEWRSLHAHHRAWIERSPFCVLATSGADGTCDVSPKGDPAGFTLILDDSTLVIPDRPGNRRVDGFRNVLTNPHVGLIYLVPGREETVRVNGRARLLTDAPFFDQLIVKGHRPSLALLVEIEQVFFHCAKAFKRSKLWDPETWSPKGELPSIPQITKDTMEIRDTLQDLEEYYGQAYSRKLYQA